MRIRRRRAHAVYHQISRLGYAALRAIHPAPMFLERKAHIAHAPLHRGYARIRLDSHILLIADELQAAVIRAIDLEHRAPADFPIVVIIPFGIFIVFGELRPVVLFKLRACGQDKISRRQRHILRKGQAVGFQLALRLRFDGFRRRLHLDRCHIRKCRARRYAHRRGKHPYPFQHASISPP